MFQNLTKKQKKALDKAIEIYKYAKSHPSIIEYRRKAIEDYGFYDGTGQWPAHILKELRARGQDVITVNKIKNRVNYMSGVEIQTRHRVAFRTHSGKPEEDELAKALTHLGYAIQENQDISYKSSLKFKDALVTGIGWSNIYRDPKSGEIKYDTVNHMDVYFDPDDLTPNLTEMTFVARTRWMPIFKAKELWANKAKYLDILFEENLQNSDRSGEFEHRQHEESDDCTIGEGGHGSRINVVEVQYKEKKDSYCGFDSQGYYFQTFDKEEAEKLNAGEQEVEVKAATQTIRVVYCGEILLEYAPLEPNLPDLADFTYIPCIWTRRQNDGVPDGWISVMKDIQRESNYRRTKLINNLNSFKAVIDASAIGPGKNVEQIRAEIKRPDSIMIKSGSGEMSIESNQPLASGQFEMLQRGDQEFQEVSGIFDEALGKATNAQSGVAIRERQVNSVRNQVFAFDNLRMMKKREARMMLSLIQGGGDKNIESQILTDDEKESVILNVVREIDGEQIILNDIRTLPLSIFVEEVPDYESAGQEQQTAIENLLANPNAQLILQSPMLLKRLGIRDYKELAEEFQQITQQQQAQEQAMAAQQQGGEQPQMSPAEQQMMALQQQEAEGESMPQEEPNMEG